MKWFLLTLLLAGCSTPSIEEEYKDWPLKPKQITPTFDAVVVPLEIYGQQGFTDYSLFIDHGVEL